MRRTDRLFELIQLFRGGHLWRGRDLAERLEVSLRTIYRDIDTLIASGVPIEGEAGVGYILRAGYDLPPLMFTQSEISALVAGARLIRAWGGLDMAAAAEEALVKIRAVLPEDARSRVETTEIHAMTPPSHDTSLRECLDALDKAVSERRRLTLDYRDSEDRPSSRRPLRRQWTVP